LISVSLIYSVGSKNNSNVSDTQNNQGQYQTLPHIEPVTAKDHILGNPNAKVIVVEYSDFECPFCKTFHGTMKQLMALYGNNLALVYRHYPFDELHPKARNEAEASECAAQLGGETAFWSFMDRLFTVTPSNNNLDPAELPQIAEFIGLSKTKFNECLQSGVFKDTIQKAVDDGNAIGMEKKGTPFSVVLVDGAEKDTIPGALPFNTLKVYFDTLITNQ